MTDNYPPGTWECDPHAPWNREARTCGDCSHCMEACCDFGVCALEFERAIDAGCPSDPREAARWGLDWGYEHLKDCEEDTCGMWTDWRRQEE